MLNYKLSTKMSFHRWKNVNIILTLNYGWTRTLPAIRKISSKFRTSCKRKYKNKLTFRPGFSSRLGKADPANLASGTPRVWPIQVLKYSGETFSNWNVLIGYNLGDEYITWKNLHNFGIPGTINYQKNSIIDID